MSEQIQHGKKQCESLMKYKNVYFVLIILSQVWHSSTSTNIYKICGGTYYSTQKSEFKRFIG